MPYRNGVRVNWKAKVDLHRYLDDDDSREGMLRSAKGIRAEMERAKRLPLFDQDEVYRLDEALDYMDGMADEGDLEGFNDALNDLYDWGDANLVWMGGEPT